MCLGKRLGLDKKMEIKRLMGGLVAMLAMGVMGCESGPNYVKNYLDDGGHYGADGGMHGDTSSTTCYGMVCDDGNPCTEDYCDDYSGVCKVTALTANACDDGNACTVSDKCQNGACHPGSAKSCDDGNVCTLDTCDAAGGCKHTPTGATGCPSTGFPTGPGNGTTPGCKVPGDCNDGNVCTDDLCENAACKHVPVPGCGAQGGKNCSKDSDCVDTHDCTADICQAGKCVNTQKSNCGFPADAPTSSLLILASAVDTAYFQNAGATNVCIGGYCKGSSNQEVKLPLMLGWNERLECAPIAQASSILLEAAQVVSVNECQLNLYGFNGGSYDSSGKFTGGTMVNAYGANQSDTKPVRAQISWKWNGQHVSNVGLVTNGLTGSNAGKNFGWDGDNWDGDSYPNLGDNYPYDGTKH